MSKILVIAEHDGSKLNPATAKCVACASAIPGADITVLVLAASAGAVAAQAGPAHRCGGARGGPPRPHLLAHGICEHG